MVATGDFDNVTSQGSSTRTIVNIFDRVVNVSGVVNQRTMIDVNIGDAMDTLYVYINHRTSL